MQTSIASESLIPLSVVCREYPSHPNLATVNRWVHHGVRGVKLESVMHGGRRFTSRQALARFTEAINEPEPVSA